ncbi:hypothetical protein DAPPUDRAFT_256614 [Daphnia pulex]|uniref:Uncharacterized protein n=1 Tax=Daphnia pulex TaxID=6669 RepID=E9HBS1_DAPPU|nr:hypothetical protein DAPPUDRAFT_256614 [Daphnia pulex]|eukprot:EFX70822.1 hypothetical protein DAPPUDRAFT_256614 [Daphnia pulex]
MAFKAYVNPTHTNSQTKITNSTLAINTTKQASTEVTLFEVGIDNKLECDVGLCSNVVKFTREPSFEETHGDENSNLYKLELREVKVDIHNEASKFLSFY